MASGGDVDTRLLRVDRSEHVFKRFQVQVLAGPDKGKTCAAPGDELAIGTAPGNHLVLTDPTVSRHHCEIAVTPDGCRLRDLGSTNGTSLAGFRVQVAFLRHGATFGVGVTTLRFDSLDEEIHQSLSPEQRCGRLVGRSDAMRRIFALLPRVAGSDTTVLLEGETGTGKGLLAEAIHQQSPRHAGPLVVVDCGALPHGLIESELFGHERGAFTGAHVARAGAFEEAAGGTVFLDEIGELPLDLQPKLLRALEERMIKRVGGNQPVRVDLRVLAATNRDLRQEVNRGAFRSDLFYRLNVVRIAIPPLRERPEDTELLIAHFYEQVVGVAGAAPPAPLVQALTRQTWPGNVRELRAAVERAVLVGELDGAADTRPHAGATVPPPPGGFDLSVPFRAAKERVVGSWERAYLKDLLGRTGGNLTHAARAARMDRNYLRELLKKHGLAARDDA